MSGIAGCGYRPRGSGARWKSCAITRLIETFLYQVLDYPIEELHEEAERLEHFNLGALRAADRRQAGEPQDRSSRPFDPHHGGGDAGGERPARESILLRTSSGDGTFVIDSISDRDAHSLRSIEACGITPGARLRVRKSASSEGYSGADRTLLEGLRSLPRGCAGCTGRPSAEITVRRGSYESRTLAVFLQQEPEKREWACKENGGQQIVCCRHS